MGGSSTQGSNHCRTPRRRSAVPHFGLLNFMLQRTNITTAPRLAPLASIFLTSQIMYISYPYNYKAKQNINYAKKAKGWMTDTEASLLISFKNKARNTKDMHQSFVCVYAPLQSKRLYRSNLATHMNSNATET